MEPLRCSGFGRAGDASRQLAATLVLAALAAQTATCSAPGSGPPPKEGGSHTPDLVLPAASPGAPREPGPGPRERTFDAVAVNARCEACHAEIAAEWRGSLHRAAYTDSVFQSQLEHEPFDFCKTCHAPEARPDGEDQEPLRNLGIGCVTCHVVGDTLLAVPAAHATTGQPVYVAVGPTVGQPDLGAGGATAGQPAHVAVGPTVGQPDLWAGGATAGQPVYVAVGPTVGQPDLWAGGATAASAGAEAPGATARDGEHHVLLRTPAFEGPMACGGCHEFAFPDSASSRAPLLMQSTMKEHIASAHAADRCAECHMPIVRTPAGRHRSHAFAASRDEAFVRSAILVETAPFENHTLALTLHPGRVGHAFPTGDMLRRLRFLVDVRDASGALVDHEERTLARHFGFTHAPGVAPKQVLRSDDRVGASPDPVVLRYTVKDASRAASLKYSLRYERVSDPIGQDGAPVIDGWTSLAEGALSLP